MTQHMTGTQLGEMAKQRELAFAQLSQDQMRAMADQRSTLASDEG